MAGRCIASKQCKNAQQLIAGRLQNHNLDSLCSLHDLVLKACVILLAHIVPAVALLALWLGGVRFCLDDDRADEFAEERLRREGTALEFWVELRADKPGMILQFH